MNRYLHILFLFLLSITIYAQRAPITVTTILTPPYTTSLSTMAESGSTRLMVNLLVNDVTITEIPVKLHIKMESAGITIESIPTQVVRPMFLGGGEARVLTGDDFAEYLRLDNLNFKGLSKDAYVKSGQLPAGLWKFSVSVRHFYTNKTISNIGTATAWITSYQPPVLTSPKDGDIAPSNAALPLTFSWQASKHTGGTAAIMYRFEMWERRIDGVPAQAVAASVPPIYTTETAGLTATVLPATLALEPGMKYCWRVTAYDPSGMVTIENKGESEVRTFQYLEKCPEVCGLTVDIKDDTGYASWEENRLHLGGYNFEFYDDEGTCHKTLWGSSNKTAGLGGEYGKTWHVRVQGVCRSGIEGPWSDWVDFTIPEAFKPLKDENGKTYECGMEIPERVITNFELTDNIQKGDTLEDERGTTKYIIHSATKNEDGSFRGLSYMKLSFWGVKVLGEFNNMKVNTDGVIIGRYAWKSVKSDLLVADPEAIEKWADELALEMAGATYNNTIKDTIVLKYSQGYVRFETIRREGDKYFAVTSDNKDVEITSMINGKTRALVQDGDGHELVIDKDGNVMGVEEYKKCGGSKALLRENIKEKDSQVTKSGNVKFFSAGKYLFDTYDDYTNAAKGYAERFPSIGEGDYRPAYACAESNTKIEIKAEPYANITFKNERGVPLICKGGILEVTARGDRDTTSIYAYDADNHIVGKVNVLSYDKQTRKICLIPIGDTKAPDASAVKQGLDEIFAKLMVDFDVTIGEPITIQYAKDNIFTHGGSGMIGVYNTDQKAAISKLKERGIDNETVYLFFVNDCKSDDEKDNVSGYMPRGYQFGFIYKELSNFRTIAHEICHGAFHLKHTFDATDYIAPEGATDNLMDYAYGQPKTLNHWQWKDIHQPKSVRFKWLQDEEGAEAISLLSIITEGHEISVESITNNGRITVITPSGKPFTIGENVKILDFTPSPHELPQGSLCAFTTEEGNTYVAVYRNADQQFLGYVKVLDPTATSIKDRIQYKADGKTPDCILDSYTKSLSPNDAVLIGVPDGQNCAINVFPIEYSKIGSYNDVNVEGYNGAGVIASKLEIDLTGSSPIVVADPTACFTSKYAKEYYESINNTSDLELRSIVLRIAKLMDLMAIESGGDILFEDYLKYASKRNNPHIFGDPQLWGGTIEDYKLFEEALHAFLFDKQKLEKLIEKCSDNNKLIHYAWLYLYKYEHNMKPELRNMIISRLAQDEMRGNVLFGDGQEYLILKYIETIPETKDECEKFIQFLQRDNNMQNLCNHIDNVVNDNYTQFIARVTKIFCIANEYRTPNSLESKKCQNFIWCKMFRDEIGSKYEYYNRMYSTEYVDNQIEITQQKGFILEFYPKAKGDPIDPFAWVYVTFLTAPDNIDESIKVGDVIAMPAFLFAWMCNEYKNQKITDYIGDAMTIASIFVSVGQFYKAVTIYKAFVLGASIANLADVKTWIEKKLGPEAAASWQLLSCVIPDSQSAFSALKNPQETYDAINAFIMAWDTYVLLNDIDNCKEKAAVENIISELKGLTKQ